MDSSEREPGLVASADSAGSSANIHRGSLRGLSSTRTIQRAVRLLAPRC
jgi:hypothetical protein